MKERRDQESEGVTFMYRPLLIQRYLCYHIETFLTTHTAVMYLVLNLGASSSLEPLRFWGNVVPGAIVYGFGV